MSKRIPVLEAKNLSFIYPESKYFAFHDIDFAVYEGEYVGITGASGVGKTTLCLAMAGVIPHLIDGHLRGEMYINNTNTIDLKIADLALNVGLVMQDPETQLFSLSVMADVTFGLENLRFPREKILERAEWALEKVGMSEYKERPSGSLSGGQKQRVALACALALGTKIIILDEPTSELDPIGSEEVFMTLKSLREEGLTIVLVEQKVQEIARFVDRLIYIKDGTIAMDLAPREFFENMRKPYFQNDRDIYIPQVTELAFELSKNHYSFDPLPLNEDEFFEQYKSQEKIK